MADHQETPTLLATAEPDLFFEDNTVGRYADGVLDSGHDDLLGCVGCVGPMLPQAPSGLVSRCESSPVSQRVRRLARVRASSARPDPAACRGA